MGRGRRCFERRDPLLRALEFQAKLCIALFELLNLWVGVLSGRRRGGRYAGEFGLERPASRGLLLKLLLGAVEFLGADDGLLFEEVAVGGKLLFALLVFGDVHEHAGEVGAQLLRVGDETRFLADPDNVAGAREDAVFSGDVFPVRQTAVEIIHDALAVVLVHELAPEGRLIAPGVAWMAEQFLETGADEERGRGVAEHNDIVGHRDAVEHGGVAAVGGAHPLHRGNVAGDIMKRHQLGACALPEGRRAFLLQDEFGVVVENDLDLVGGALLRGGGEVRGDGVLRVHGEQRLCDRVGETNRPLLVNDHERSGKALECGQAALISRKDVVRPARKPSCRVAHCRTQSGNGRLGGGNGKRKQCPGKPRSLMQLSVNIAGSPSHFNHLFGGVLTACGGGGRLRGNGETTATTTR